MATIPDTDILQRWSRRANESVTNILQRWPRRATVPVTGILQHWPNRATIPVTDIFQRWPRRATAPFTNIIQRWPRGAIIPVTNILHRWPRRAAIVSPIASIVVPVGHLFLPPTSVSDCSTLHSTSLYTTFRVFLSFSKSEKMFIGLPVLDMATYSWPCEKQGDMRSRPTVLNV